MLTKDILLDILMYKEENNHDLTVISLSFWLFGHIFTLSKFGSTNS